MDQTVSCVMDVWAKYYPPKTGTHKAVTIQVKTRILKTALEKFSGTTTASLVYLFNGALGIKKPKQGYTTELYKIAALYFEKKPADFEAVFCGELEAVQQRCDFIRQVNTTSFKDTKGWASILGSPLFVELFSSSQTRIEMQYFVKKTIARFGQKYELGKIVEEKKKMYSASFLELTGEYVSFVFKEKTLQFQENMSSLVKVYSEGVISLYNARNREVESVFEQVLDLQFGQSINAIALEISNLNSKLEHYKGIKGIFVSKVMDSKCQICFDNKEEIKAKDYYGCECNLAMCLSCIDKTSSSCPSCRKKT